MKSKLFISFMILMLLCSLFAVGCEKQHEHTFDTDWSKDAQYHWYAATCGHNVDKDKEEHTFVGDECSVCHYKKEHTHNWKPKYDADKHYEECDCNEKRNEEAHTYGDFITTETEHYKECKCGYVIEKGKHTYDKGICTVCGYGTKEQAVFTAEMLESLKGDAIALSGEVLYRETRISEDGPGTSNEIKSDLITEFTADTFRQVETVRESDVVYERTLFKGDDGNPYMYIYNILQNKYDAVRFGSDENQDGVVDEYYPWSMFVNPFNALTVDKFTAGENDNEFILDDKVASEVSNVLTGWNDKIISFIVTVKDNKVVSMKMETAVENHTSPNYGDYTSYSAYELNIVAGGKDVVAPTVPEPYPSTEGHTELLKALKELETESYTIVHTDKDPYGIVGDIEETIYYTPDAVYVDYEEEPYGYLQAEGKVIHFFNEDGNLTEFAVYNDETIAEDYFPHIDFAPAIFKDLGNGVFEAYNEDIAEAIASRLDLIELSAIDAKTLKIELGEDGHIAKITYTYSAGIVEMVYSDFGSTEIDLDFSVLLGGKTDIPEGVPEEAFGTFEDDDGEYKLVLTASTCTINDSEVEFELKVAEDGVITLTFSYDGKECECNFTESGVYNDVAYWYIMSDDFSIMAQLNKKA